MTIRFLVVLVLFVAAPLAAQGVSDPIQTTDIPPSAAPADLKAASPSAAVQRCEIKLIEVGAGASDLFALCAEKALRIGRSLSFTASYNAALGRYLIVNQIRSGEQVFLVKPAERDQPITFDNLTSSLAAAALGARAIQANTISGVDSSSFSTSGIVKVARITAKPGPSGGADRGSSAIGDAAVTKADLGFATMTLSVAGTGIKLAKAD